MQTINDGAYHTYHQDEQGSTFAGPIPEEISRILIERADSIGGVGSTLGQGEKQRLL